MADQLAPPSDIAVAPERPTPETPDPYADHATILALAKRKMSQYTPGREGITRAAWRNILFYRGHQWIIWDRGMNRWRPSLLRKNTPTPVTNRYASTMDSYMSVLARIEPRLNFRPGTDDPDDRATADVATRAIQVIEEEVGIRELRQRVGTWSGLAGDVWVEWGYDNDPIHGTRLLQHDQCLQCGWTGAPMPAPICPECLGMTQPAVDDKGQPVGEQVPVGKMFAEEVPGFEMYFDPAITDWKKQRAFIRKRSRALDDAKAAWPDIADRLTPDSMGTSGESHVESLATLAGHLDATQPMRSVTSGTGAQANSRVSEMWYWQMPDKTYPGGLLAIIVGGVHVVHAAPLPYGALQPDGSRHPFLPFVKFPQHFVPGSAWAKTVADDLAHKASQRNRVESLIEAILMRTANPVWLLPEGCNVTNLTGEAGQVIRYNALGPTPAKPERIPGQGVPAGLMLFLERSDKDFEELSAMFEVMKGARPEGVSAGIALQILQERAMSRFGPMFIQWEVSWAESAKIALEIFRQFATEERVLRIQGRDGAWQVSKFLGADLQGRVDVIAEAGSSMPRSTLLDRAEIEQLAAMGVINLADPEVIYKVLEIYGRTNLTEGMAADTKNAIREDEAFAALAQDPRLAQVAEQVIGALRAGVPYDNIADGLATLGLQVPRVRPAVDGHGVHSREHGTWLKSESSQTLPPVVQALAEAHKAQHDLLTAQQMQMAMSARQGMGTGTGFLTQGGAGGGQKPQNPMLAGSSGARMQGDQQEMQEQMQ